MIPGISSAAVFLITAAVLKKQSASSKRWMIYWIIVFLSVLLGVLYGCFGTQMAVFKLGGIGLILAVANVLCVDLQDTAAEKNVFKFAWVSTKQVLILWICFAYLFLVAWTW